MYVCERQNKLAQSDIMPIRCTSIGFLHEEKYFVNIIFDTKIQLYELRILFLLCFCLHEGAFTGRSTSTAVFDGTV